MDKAMYEDLCHENQSELENKPHLQGPSVLSFGDIPPSAGQSLELHSILLYGESSEECSN